MTELPPLDPIVEAFMEKADRVYPDGSSGEDFERDLSDPIKALRAEIARLERLVYVPGLWKCAKCKLTLISSTLHVNVGKVSANNDPQPCANGCGPMWRVTERDAGNELIDRMDTMVADASARPEALRTDDLKKAIGAILLKVVQGDHGYETPDGFRRWGRIQADINAEIDKTFAVSPLRLFQFDRIRRGQVMAEGIAVHAATLEEATAKAKKMADPEDGEIRLTREPQNGEGK